MYFAGSSAINKGIKRGVETFGPKVTQTPVTLDDVSISVLSGNGTLKGLYVGNPEGYKSENIFALGQIDIEIDTGTVMSDKIVINRIYIKQPEISYEKTLMSSNIKQLLANIEEFTGPSAPKEDEPSTGAKKQLVVKQLVIEDGTIYVGALGMGQTVPLPRIELNDIGEGNNSKTIAQVLDLVLTEVVKSIGPAIANSGELLKSGGTAALKAAQEGGIEKAGEAAEDAVNKASEGLKGLFNK